MLAVVLIAVGALLGACLGYAVDRATVTEYRATAYVVTSADDVTNDPSSVFQASYGMWRVPEYEAITHSPSFLARVVADKKLGIAPEELAGRIHTGTAKKTAVLTVSATDGSAVIAAALANSVAEMLTQVIEERERGIDVRATVAAGAVPPPHADSPPALLVVLQYALAGAAIASFGTWMIRRGRTRRDAA